MTTTINASTSSGLVVTPDNSGNVLLQYNGQSAPAFAVYPSAASTNLTSSTWTKIAFDTELFDTNSNFDTSTNRFTPTVAGYYQINLQVYCASSGNNAYWQWTGIFKNGTSFVENINVNASAQLQSFSWGPTQVIYMNGTTDYLEFYVNIYVASGTPKYYGGGSSTGPIQTIATGCLLRGA